MGYEIIFINLGRAIEYFDISLANGCAMKQIYPIFQDETTKTTKIMDNQLCIYNL